MMTRIIGYEYVTLNNNHGDKIKLCKILEKKARRVYSPPRSNKERLHKKGSRRKIKKETSLKDDKRK